MTAIKCIEQRIRRVAKRQGFIARKSRSNGLWYIVSHSNWLLTSEQGMTNGEALFWLYDD